MGRQTCTTLLSAVNAHAEKIHLCSGASFASDSDNPLVFSLMDSKNVFNALNRHRFIQESCETPAHAPNLRPSNQWTADPSSHGWDALWPYFAAHYGCHGSLMYYSSVTSSTTSVVQSQSGVQQGDPLSSNWFAQGIHPILLDLWCQLT
jgi:hypothetical protein